MHERVLPTLSPLRISALLPILGLLGPGTAPAETIFPLDPEALLSLVHECRDGVDNDADGLVDFPDDPECADADDEAERTPTPPPRTRRIFTPLRLPALPEGIDPEGSRALVHDVSRNGRVKVGELIVANPDPEIRSTQAASVVWTRNRPRIIDDVFDRLDDPESVAGAYGVSDDGLWVVGNRGAYASAQGYRWRQGSLEELPPTPLSDREPSDWPLAASDRGVVVGRSANRAVRWDEQGAQVIEPGPFDQESGFAARITPGGDLTVGAIHEQIPGPLGDAIRQLPSLWYGSDSRPLPLLADQLQHGYASDVSDDGRVIVGAARVLLGADETPGVAAFHWTEEGVTWLGQPGFDLTNHALMPWSTSGDGALSVGWLSGGWLRDPVGPVVLAGGRLRSLVDLLENEYGVDLEGWDLSNAPHAISIRISGDGRTLVGNALPPGAETGAYTAYQVRLPPACSDALDNDGDGFVDFPDDDGCRSPRDRSEERPPHRGRRR